MIPFRNMGLVFSREVLGWFGFGWGFFVFGFLFGWGFFFLDPPYLSACYLSVCRNIWACESVYMQKETEDLYFLGT